MASTLDWKQVGRNDPCPCGSGKKYKHCHMSLDREAVQQAEMEAAQRAEEERLAQLRERAKAQAQEEGRIFAPPDTLDDEWGDDEIDPNTEQIDAFWEAFDDAEGDRKWELCRSAINDQLPDSEFVFESFIELHRDTLKRGLENRFVQLVLHLREKCPDAYRETIVHLFEWVFPLLSPTERESLAPGFVDDLIADGADQIEPFLNVVDMLAVLGEDTLYTRVVRATQESVAAADSLLEWAVDIYRSQYLDTYLFEYLENTPAEIRRDPERIDEMIQNFPDRDNLVDDEFIAYALRLAGERHLWTRDDFPVYTSGRQDDRIPSTTVDNLAYLVQEFVACLRWEEGIPFIKGDLGVSELRKFLSSQEIPSSKKKPKSRKTQSSSPDLHPAPVLPFCPNRQQLDGYLFELVSFLNYQPYRAVALMEIIPAWLQFLDERGLIDADSHVASLRSLRDIADSLQVHLTNESLHPGLIENLAVAWAIQVAE